MCACTVFERAAHALAHDGMVVALQKEKETFTHHQHGLKLPFGHWPLEVALEDCSPDALCSSPAQVPLGDGFQWLDPGDVPSSTGGESCVPYFASWVLTISKHPPVTCLLIVSGCVVDTVLCVSPNSLARCVPVNAPECCFSTLGAICPRP